MAMQGYDAMPVSRQEPIVLKAAVSFLLCMTAFTALRSVAAADPNAEVDALWTTYGFTSPQNAYGPWNAQELRTRFHLGRNAPGVDLINQNDANAVDPQHGQYVVVDDYYQIHNGFFAYAAVGAGSGNTFPLRSAYGEVDLQVLRSSPLLIGAGADVTSSADGTVQRYFSIGPTYYFNGGDVTLRYLPTASSNNANGASGLFALQLGAESIRSTVLTVQYGNSPPFLARGGALALGTGERAVNVDLTFKRPLRRNLGLIYGLDFAHVVDAASGDAVYIRRGVSLGLVWFSTP